ncbi:protein O-mannosyl-transferase family [Patescibacteria group bacterium]
MKNLLFIIQKHSKIIIPALLFIVVFGIYLYTSPRLPTGYADSEELMAAAYTLGVPHPPGYPLFPILGKPFTYIPIGTIAFRLSIFSSLFSAFTILLIFFIVRKLIKNTVASLLGALSLAFSYVFWLYSIIPEVFFLTGFFIALLIFILISWYQEKKQTSSKYPYIFIFVFVLAFLAQQLVLFIIPALLYFLWVIDKKIFIPSKKWLGMMAGVIAGFLPLIYFPLAASREPFIDYGNPNNLTRLWQLITRYIYRLASPHGSAYLPGPGHELKERIYQLLNYFVFLVDQFTPIVIIIAIVGILFLIIKKPTRTVGIFIFLAFIFTGPVMALYVAPQLIDYSYQTYISWILPEYASTFGIETLSEAHNSSGALERFYIMSFIAFSIFIGVGVFFLLSLMKKFKFGFKPTIIIICLFFLIPVFPLRDNFSVINKRNFYLGQDFAENLFLHVEPNAILITRGDRPTFAAYYYQQVEKKRLDVTVISFGWRSWNLERLKKREPAVFNTENPHLLAVFRDIIQTNVDKRPVFTTGLPNAELIQLGIAGNPFVVSPRGMIYKIDWDFDLGTGDYWEKMIWHGPKDVNAYYDQYAKELIEQYIIGHSNNYYHYRVRGYHDLAKQELDEMLEINPFHSLTQGVIKDWEEFGRIERGVRRLILGEAKTHFDLALSYLKEEKPAEAMAESWTAVYIEPDNNIYKFQLGGLYETLGWYSETLEQYEEVLAREQENKTLIEKTEERIGVVKEKILRRQQPPPPLRQKILKWSIDSFSQLIGWLNLKKPFQ